MAKADYIRCDVCDCKVIYDGSWGTRDNWTEDEWPTVICGDCTRALPEITKIVAAAKAAQAAK